MSKIDLLQRAADAIESGSEWEGLCADCGIDSSNKYDENDNPLPPGEHHADDCIVRELRKRQAAGMLRLLFDGPPGPGRLPGLIEVEDENGRSVNAGEWREEPPYWVLYVPSPSQIFSELVSTMLSKWVAQQALDAAGWISVEERLPTDDTQIDIWVERMQRQDGIDRSSNERGWYEPETEQWMLLDHGQVGRYCLPGEEKVTHWRPIAPPPINRRKIERADVGA